jgi:hypothetical protein
MAAIKNSPMFNFNVVGVKIGDQLREKYRIIDIYEIPLHDIT